MTIKDSANVGGALERLMEDEDATTTQLSFDFHLSKSMVNHIKRDYRKMPADVARESIELYDNPEYTMDILFEFSNGYTPPVLRGSHIDQHRLSLAVEVEKEMKAFIHRLENGRLERPPGSLSKVEREAVESLMDSLITCRVLEANLMKQLQLDYRISIKERVLLALRKWRAVGWL